MRQKAITSPLTSLRWIVIIALLFTAISTGPTRTAHAASTWYVAPNGADTNKCLTVATACKTINSAIGRAATGDSISIGAGTYVERLIIDKDLVVIGAGATATIIDGNGTGTGIATSSGTIHISDVTIQHGGTPFDRSSYGSGIINAGTLVLNNSIVSNNGTVAVGGGILNTGTMTINSSTVSNNVARGSGGIDNQGVLILNNSIISGNRSGGGGGIVNRSGGTLRISTSTISDNTAGNGGGGVSNEGSAIITGSNISQNHATNSDISLGGGIYNAINGTLTLIDNIISDNNATESGGGVYNDGILTIRNSTVSGNSTTKVDPADNSIMGGGIQNNRSLAVINSTISGNSSKFGGGISSTGQLTITSTTITANDGLIGGGISAVHADIANTILAKNTATGSAPDCTTPQSGEITSQGYNLVGDTNGCNFLRAITDQSGSSPNVIEPKLGSLQDNGGLTPTHALLPGSPAIDSGNPSTPGSGDTSCPATDQRSMPRPKDGDSDGIVRCDIGAYEVPSLPVSPFTGTLVLIYTSGDNNLSSDMLKLINNAEKAADNANVTTLLLLDGPGEDDSYLYLLQPDQDLNCPNYVNPSCNGRYVEDRNFWHWSDDVGSPSTLAEFLNVAFHAYRDAHQVVLSLVGHGGGWSPEVSDAQPSGHGGQPGADSLGGMLRDDHPARALSTRGLGQALSKATRHIDLLYLDACDMAMAEVAYEVKDSVGYLLASENWKWAAFPYDAHLAAINGSMGAQQIGEAWLHNETQILRPEEYPSTYSLIDLKAMDSLHGELDNLANNLTNALQATSSTARARILDALASTDCFDSNFDGAINSNDNYCDLASFTRQLDTQFTDNVALKSAAQRVTSVVATAVVTKDLEPGTPWIFPTQRWTWENHPGGISIYLPLHQDDWRRRYYGTLRFAPPDGPWNAFLTAWWGGAEPPLGPDCPPTGCPSPGQLSLAQKTYLPLIRR